MQLFVHVINSYTVMPIYCLHLL